jgi:hypothetical protein
VFYKIWCDGHASVYGAEFPSFLFYMSVSGLHIQVCSGNEIGLHSGGTFSQSRQVTGIAQVFRGFALSRNDWGVVKYRILRTFAILLIA